MRRGSKGREKAEVARWYRQEHRPHLSISQKTVYICERRRYRRDDVSLIMRRNREHHTLYLGLTTWKEGTKSTSNILTLYISCRLQLAQLTCSFLPSLLIYTHYCVIFKSHMRHC
ncbi:hypothetical protein L1887_22534 [Cichorium endivia]|nr:hypothetical protein L1887_22534 [Cichorium endivia]